MLSTSVSEYIYIREKEKGGRVGLSPSVSKYTDIKTDRKSQNREGEWGWIAVTSVSDYRDIRQVEQGERVGLSPSVSEYMDIKTDKKSQDREVMWGWIAVSLCI